MDLILQLRTYGSSGLVKDYQKNSRKCYIVGLFRKIIKRCFSKYFKLDCLLILATRYSLSRQIVASTTNVVRQSTGHYDVANELEVMIESPIINPAQAARYSVLIHKEYTCQQPYDDIIHEESPRELNEQHHISSEADEYKYTAVVDAEASQAMCAHSSDDDSRHIELMCDQEEPHCDTEIPSEYLTIG